MPVRKNARFSSIDRPCVCVSRGAGNREGAIAYHSSPGSAGGKITVVPGYRL